MIAAFIIVALVLNFGLAGMGGLFLATATEEQSGRGFASYMTFTGATSFALLLTALLGVQP